MSRVVVDVSTSVDGRDVVVPGGAETVAAALACGEVDELRLHVVPVLLGGGTRLFPDGGPHHELEPGDVVSTPPATHLAHTRRGRS